MSDRQRLTVWIDNNADPGNPDPPLVIDAGLDAEYLIREEQGDIQVIGPTAPGAMQVGVGSANFFLYTVQGVVDKAGVAALQRIMLRQKQQGPPINFRDEIDRIDTLRITGTGSRQQLDAGAFPDSLETASNGIQSAFFESIGILELSDQPQQLRGPASDGTVKYLISLRIFEVT